MEDLRLLLSGEKQFVPKHTVIPVFSYERYSELTVESLLAYGHDNIDDFASYLPNNCMPSMCDRRYLMDLINTLRPHSIEQLRIAAINRSKGNSDNPNEARRIVLSEEFRQVFQNQLFPLGKTHFTYRLRTTPISQA